MLEQEIRGRLLRLRKELRAAGCTVDISFTEDAASKALPREAKLRGGVVIGYRPGKFTMVISTGPGEQPCELALALGGS